MALFSFIFFKPIALREEQGGIKDLQDLTQLPGITNFELEEWKEEDIIIEVE